MDDTFCVRHLQKIEEAGEYLGDLRPSWHARAKEIAQGRSFDQLHDEVASAVYRVEVEHRNCADVLETCSHARFSQEPRTHRFVVRDLCVQDLEGDGTAGLQMTGAINDSRASIP